MKTPPIRAEVRARPNEHPERLINRFIRKVKKEKIIEKLRDLRYYEKPSAKRNKLKQRNKRISKK